MAVLIRQSVVLDGAWVVEIWREEWAPRQTHDLYVDTMMWCRANVERHRPDSHLTQHNSKPNPVTGRKQPYFQLYVATEQDALLIKLKYA